MEKSIVVLIFLVVALALAGLAVYYIMTMFGGASASKDFTVTNLQVFDNGKCYMTVRNVGTLSANQIQVQLDSNLDGNPDSSFTVNVDLPGGRERFVEGTFNKHPQAGSRVKIIVTVTYGGSGVVTHVYDAVALAW